MWGPAVSQRGETLPQGSQTMTGTCWDPCLKGNCLPGYLQKKNGSDPSYIMSLTSYYLNQRKCIIQRGESSLFTLSIYSLCCDFFWLRQKGFQSFWNFAVLLSGGQVSLFWEWRRQREKEQTFLSALLQSVSLPWCISVKPLQAPGPSVEWFSSQRALLGAGQSLVFSTFLQYSI